MKCACYKFIALLSFLLLLTTIISCTDEANNDGVVDNPTKTEEQYAIDFIYSVMREVYFWLDESSISQTDRTTYSSPPDYFRDILYPDLDRYSVIANRTLLKSALAAQNNGVFGFNFTTTQINSKESIVITQVLGGSPMLSKGFQRSDVITKVDGMDATADNFADLLANKASVTFTFLRIKSDGSYEEKSETVARSNFTTDPIRITDIKVLNNGTRVGYFVYTTFSGDQESLLRQALSYFKTNTVDELVVDLRYNGGGLVSNAFIMSNSFAPQSVLNSKSLMFEYEYNQIVENFFDQERGDGWDDVMFTNDSDLLPLNLDLKRIYFITSDRTASASELVINSLAPHMEVIVVGTTSFGKPVGSALFDDDDTDNHDFAILPIMFRLANSEGKSEYYKGLTPTIIAQDDVLHPFGDLNEASFKAALDHIQGNKGAKSLGEIERLDIVSEESFFPLMVGENHFKPPYQK